jgi:hypothetical protein
LKNKKSKNGNKHEADGVYHLTCQDCGKKYAGQTGVFPVWYKEHLHIFKTKSNASKFAHGALDNSHSFGKLKILWP